jgi:hypothetical protein
MRTCQNCKKPIGKSKKVSSIYCSHDCYYEAKKARSRNRYKLINQNFEEIRKNEKILSELYILMRLKKTLFFQDLENLGFNWGVSDKEIEGKEKTIWKVVGGYAYYINPQTKNVTIWKVH